MKKKNIILVKEKACITIEVLFFQLALALVLLFILFF